MLVRLGLPTSFRRFSQVARQLGAPILISANALRKRNSVEFYHPSPQLFSGASVALDSAGFVAQARYGGFPWSVESYVRLAASYPWDFWAQMDLACEPELAKDSEEVQRRQRETVRLLQACREEAIRQYTSMPMPVLQGWKPTDYLRCAEWMGDLPALVGIGSVCRRHLSGSSGLLAVIDSLDRALPKNVLFHCFGLKGAAITRLAGHPRLHSVDSMAWDLQARYSGAHQSRTMDLRIRHLRQWYLHQIEALPQMPVVASPPLDPGAKWRQQRTRHNRHEQGLRQVNLWLDEATITTLDAHRATGEDRSKSARRLLSSITQKNRD